MHIIFVSLCLGLAAMSRGERPCYDHQKETYRAEYRPADCTQACTVTPFFSPDHSIDAYMQLIDGAEESIDLLEPSFSSWSNCTYYSSDCGGQCVGCSLQDQYNEQFPIFGALMNAVHLRNVKIRFLTNDFSTETCEGKATPLDWMSLNGVQIRMYTTTTFMHAKAMIVDKGKRTMVSSVNFSKTSFTMNREAGVIIEDCKCQLQDFYQKVFDSDWDKAYDYELQRKYSNSEIDFITNSTEMPFPDLHIVPVKGAYRTSMNTYTGVTIDSFYTAPDYARTTFMDMLNTVKTSLKIHIYQITDQDICEKILDLYKNGVNVSVLVGSYIVSYDDYKQAQICYAKLYNGGMEQLVQKSYTMFRFSHQKYCIIDNTTVQLGTGNWSPSDLPEGDSWSTSGPSVNRDMLVVITNPEVVSDFLTVFNADWSMGKPWEPKWGIGLAQGEV